jgi:hypothetical protein
MSKAPKIDGEQISAELENLSRGPFRRVLGKLLENGPSDEAIASQAERNPDRWAQTVALIARLGGYNEKLEVEGSLSLKVQQLSDSELVALLAEYQGQLDNQSNAPKLLARVNTGDGDSVAVPRDA